MKHATIEKAALSLKLIKLTSFANGRSRKKITLSRDHCFKTWQSPQKTLKDPWPTTVAAKEREKRQKQEDTDQNKTRERHTQEERWMRKRGNN